MRKLVLCILLLFASTNAFTQIQSGGHPDGDGLPSEIDENQFFSMQKKYEKLISHLNEQWSKCVPLSQKKIKSLEELYLEIFWRDFGLTMIQAECDVSNEAKKMLRSKQVTCLLTTEILRELRQFLHQSKVDPFLKFIEGGDNINHLRKYLE